MLKKVLCLLITFVLLLGAANADVYKVCDGSTRTAKATMQLHLREDPTVDSADLGTYSVTGKKVKLDGKSWDSANSIWWVRCSFTYKGKEVCGWTGKKRFDISTSALNALPEYEIGNGDNCYGYCEQYALATTQLALRSKPTTESTYVGTFYVEGEWIELVGRHWDSVNSIWWVECDFIDNGKTIHGWTGKKRFDDSTYNLSELIECDINGDYLEDEYCYDDADYDDQDDDWYCEGE